MTTLKKIIFNAQNRFNAVEAKTIKGAMGYTTLGSVKAMIRGAIGGGLLDYMIGASGDPISNGIAFGAIIDGAQDVYRLVKLHAMSRENPEQYNAHKQLHKDFGLIE